MFNVNGDFGKVRLYTNMPVINAKDLFCFTSVGWHECNSKYVQHRINGSPDMTILVTASGLGKIQLKDGEYKLTAGDIVVLPPDMYHKYYVPNNSIWEFYWLHIFNNHARYFFDRIVENSGYIFPYGDIKPLADILEGLIATQNKNDPLCAINHSLALCEFLHKLLACGAKASAQSKSWEIILENAIATLELNFDKPLNMDALSQSLFISNTHLIRLFKKKLDTTPYQYLENYRISRACTLLSHTVMNISDISSKVGYKSLSNFIAQFKKIKHLTPKQYRRLKITS